MGAFRPRRRLNKPPPLPCVSVLGLFSLAHFAFPRKLYYTRDYIHPPTVNYPLTWYLFIWFALIESDAVMNTHVVVSCDCRGGVCLLLWLSSLWWSVVKSWCLSCVSFGGFCGVSLPFNVPGYHCTRIVWILLLHVLWRWESDHNAAAAGHPLTPPLTDFYSPSVNTIYRR